MAIVVNLVFVIASLKYLLKSSMGSGWAVWAGYAGVAALSALAAFPWIIRQPSTGLDRLLTQSIWMENFAFMIAFEAISGMFVLLYWLKQSWYVYLIRRFPGVLSVIGLVYYEYLFFQWRVGHPFWDTAILFAILTLIFVFLISFALHSILKEGKDRKELSLLFNMVLLGLALLLASSVASYNDAHAQMVVDGWALLTCVVGSGLFVGFGWFIKRKKLKH
ncbi:MAG: hypothetical protein AB7D40_08130 [Bacteroidales bacterium]